MEKHRDASRRGLLRLMLRLPALRGELQVMWPADASLQALCEAYEDAVGTLDRLLTRAGASETGLVEEYRELCKDLETDVTARCVHGSRPPN